MWWRPDFETSMYPFLPPNVKHPKVHFSKGIFLSKCFNVRCHSFKIYLHGVGMYKTLPCKASRKSKVHGAKKHEVAISSFVPNS